MDTEFFKSLVTVEKKPMQIIQQKLVQTMDPSSKTVGLGIVQTGNDRSMNDVGIVFIDEIFNKSQELVGEIVNKTLNAQFSKVKFRIVQNVLPSFMPKLLV